MVTILTLGNRMSISINFCGDSYCAWLDETTKQSWGVQLADKLNAKIIGSGKAATAYEYAIKSFNPKSDITIFCWTNSSRLYHKDYMCTFSNGVKTLQGFKSNELLTAVASAFYRQFYNSQYFDELQKRSLYWFDHEVLNNYKGLALHIFNFKKTYTFKNGLEYDRVLKDISVADVGSVCHMTPESNQLVADEIYDILKNHL